ncbi:MAG: hypothetical protein J1F01_00735 [Oscillospiraceae bacterium]|nr:hypothetical protein [Oscillospiraceae bacterium]
MSETEKNKTKIIQFRVSENEYKQLKNGADNTGQSVSVYARECALNPYSLSVNYDEIELHTQEISEIKSAVNRLVYTLVSSGNYYPADIENILKMLTEISESEKKLIKLFQKSQPQLRRELEKIVSRNREKEV